MNAELSWRDMGRAWQRFFFEPQDTLPCDVLRIGYALLVLTFCLCTWPNVHMWYGETGVLPLELSRQLIDPDTWTLFSVLPKSDGTAIVGLSLLTLHTGLLLVGIASRWQAVGVYVWLVSFHHRNLLVLDAEDSVLRILGFLVMLMPIGHTLSWDAWRRGGRWLSAAPVLRPCWALRLLQLEMCLIFLGCAYSKSRGEYWLDGRAIYYVSRLDDLFGRFPTPRFLWESMTLMRWMGWLVIAVEALVPVFIWFRESRRWALLVAIGFHLALDYSMNLFLFHWIMIVGWLSFVSADTWRWMLSSRRLWGEPRHRPAVVSQGSTT